MATQEQEPIATPAGTPTGQPVHAPGPEHQRKVAEQVPAPSTGYPPGGGKMQRRLAVAAFLAPALLVYIIFVLFPIGNSMYISTLDWNGISEPVSVGMANYRELIADSAAWQSLQHNVVLLVVSLLVQLPVGLGLALLISSGIRGSKFFRTVWFLPLLMSTVAIGLLWAFIFNPNFGVINGVLEMIGLGHLRQGWLGDESFALGAIIVVICWQFIPFYMILYRAGLTAIPQELNEAAIVDGATSWQRFRGVTLPLLSGTTRTAIVLSVIGSLKYFDLIWIMTGGGPSGATEVLATYMYRHAFSRGNLGYGSAVAVMLLAMAMVATAIVLFRPGARRNEA